MTGHNEPLGARVRALLGQARLVYWDDAALSEALQGLLDRLESPLRVALAGAGADAEPAASGIAEGRLTFVDDDPDAVVTVADVPGTASDPVAHRMVAAHDPDGLAGALQHLAEDADALRALGALAGLRRLLAEHPRHGSEKVARDAERLAAFAPERLELAAVVALRDAPVAGIGPAGTARALAVLSAARHPDRGVHRPRTAEYEAELGFWRAAAQDPTLPRASRGIAATVARACERLLADAVFARASAPVVDQRA